ncbi:hypothetical protein HPB51_004205 [Rhipicephalus microplus]|uniref:Uncharacterized protein n=1 Tax=Rhipicephalus microplus TaxID=6941 RepID=A0A9J6DYR1_RHIMP|nr:hypothetical protein HPB51_004205 [Rhipicephalus microplus]
MSVHYYDLVGVLSRYVRCIHESSLVGKVCGVCREGSGAGESSSMIVDQVWNRRASAARSAKPEDPRTDIDFGDSEDTALNTTSSTSSATSSACVNALDVLCTAAVLAQEQTADQACQTDDADTCRRLNRFLRCVDRHDESTQFPRRGLGERPLTASPKLRRLGEPKRAGDGDLVRKVEEPSRLPAWSSSMGARLSSNCRRVAVGALPRYSARRSGTILLEPMDDAQHLHRYTSLDGAVEMLKRGKRLSKFMANYFSDGGYRGLLLRGRL